MVRAQGAIMIAKPPEPVFDDVADPRGVVLPFALAALFHPAGLRRLPLVAGLAAVIFAQSPLLWMMQWFRADMFVKLPGEPQAVRRSPAVIVAAVGVVGVYAFVLGLRAGTRDHLRMMAILGHLSRVQA